MRTYTSRAQPIRPGHNPSGLVLRLAPIIHCVLRPAPIIHWLPHICHRRILSTHSPPPLVLSILLDVAETVCAVVVLEFDPRALRIDSPNDAPRGEGTAVLVCVHTDQGGMSPRVLVGGCGGWVGG